MSAEREVCWGCQQIVRFYPESVPMSVLGEVQGADIPLCGICWTWWVHRWVNSDEDPGCRSHLIDVPRRTNRICPFCQGIVCTCTDSAIGGSDD